MISPYKINWAGFSSLDFDLWTEITFDSDQGSTSSFLNRESNMTEHYNGSYRRIHSYKYNEVLTPRITFIKQNYEDFTPEENRKILSWLTSNQKASWLEIFHDDSHVASYRLFGAFTVVEQHKITNNRIIGYECEFESANPFAWSHKFIYPEVYATIEELSNNNENNDYLMVSEKTVFTLVCNTDEYNKLIYPKVTIVFSGKNPYFPTSVNPIQDDTYYMVPNVIYSWTDEEKITHLYVNLNEDEDEGRYPVQALSGTAPDSDIITSNIEEYRKYTYYYFPDDGDYIRKLKFHENEDGVTAEWVTVTKIGMAVRINNAYTFEGETKTIESIVAGGTMDETIILDGTNKVISGTRGTATRIIGDDFNLNWIPLAYGDNNITVMGNCKIKIEWFEPRKVGSL